MYASLLLPALGGLALVGAQTALLTATESGVLPVLPTPFSGVETIEGAIVYDGPAIDGFTGPGGNASIQNNNPPATYQAVLPSTNFDNATGSLITGSITGAANANGTGVMFTVSFTGFPSEAAYGPFVYHIHTLPVPANGNCTATLGHLDPTDRGELHACEVAAPQTCQAGDLAGKHGNITTTTFSASYSDLYLSTNPSSPYFFGSKSIVIHSSNTTRLTCANFVMVANGTTGASNSTASATSTPSAYTGAAGHMSWSGSAAAFGTIAAMLVPFFL